MADTKEKKTRIYKLATEYNLSADSLVEFLNSKGFKVKNHMSLLEDDMIDAIHVHYKKEIEKAQHHYKKLAEFHQKRAERAIKDAQEELRKVCRLQNLLNLNQLLKQLKKPLKKLHR
jgi:Ni,Fe-hydrogenase maturation factor